MKFSLRFSFLAIAASWLATPLLWSQSPPKYAIIDLGADVYPRNIANNGWILLTDVNGSPYRWKRGTLEYLDYPQPHNLGVPYAFTMNKQGAVVGGVGQQAPSANNDGVGLGILWPPGSAIGQTFSSPYSLPDCDSPDGPSYGHAFFTIITDRNEIFGELYTGGCYAMDGFSHYPILNHYTLSADFSGLTALTNTHPVSIGDGSGYNWDGAFFGLHDANGAGHYVGVMWTPGAPVLNPNDPNGNGQSYITPGTLSGMVDGQAVSFFPSAINEAPSPA